MKNKLTKIIGAGLIAGISLLSGCAALDSAKDDSTPVCEAKTEERKPITASGYAYERIASDTVLAFGKIVGRGPSSETYLEARVGNDDFYVTGSSWSVFSLRDGKNTEQDYTFETRLKLNDNVTIGVDPAFWTFPGGDVFVAKFPLLYSNGNFKASFKPILDLRRGGVLYIAGASRTFPIEGTQLSLTSKVLTSYADDFSGRNGIMQVTPGIGAHFGKLGPIDINGDVNYQLGFNGRKDVLYGGLNFEFKIDKKPLIKREGK